MLDLNQILKLLDQLIEGQQQKVLKIAKESYPQVTPEDIRNPQDFEKLNTNSRFNFEDGILSGYISAKMAVLAEHHLKTNQSKP